jgi:hypothetical protein
MTFVAAAVVGAATIGGALISSRASGKAAQTQADAANRAADLQNQQFERGVELQEPFRQAGIAGQNQLLTYLGVEGGDRASPNFGKYATAQYSPEMFAKGQDPGYQFRLSEGMKGLERSAAARGGLLSGGTLKGIQRYGQDMASQEYQNAFNRYQAERTGTLNPFQSLAGVGQSTANTLGTMGMNYANQAGEAYQGAANARASGYIGGANAISGAIGNISNQYYQNQLLNRVFPQQQAQQLVGQYGAGNVYTPGGGGSIGAFSPIQDPYQ